MFKTRWFVMTLLMLGTICSVAFSTSSAKAAPTDPPAETEGYSWNGREIRFSTDNTPSGRVYFNSLRMTGPNQDNVTATWQNTYPSWTVYQATTWGWWWKGTITLNFTLDGYGARSCSVFIPAQGESPAFVQYTGNNTCRLTN